MESEYHPFRSEQAREEYYALYMERAKAWPVASETRLIDTPSGQTFIRISGRTNDPPLLLLPGSKATSLTWIPNIAALSSQYRTYALDSIYDFGLSIPQKKIKSPLDLLSWLDEVLAILIPKGKFRLAGLSYGGWLASQYALRFPERLESVVLMAPALTVLPVSPALLLRATLTLIPLPGFRKQFYYWLLHDALTSGTSGQAFVDEAVADWAVAERCFSSMPMIPAHVIRDKELHQFKVPCLFMVGENEKMYSAQKAVERLNRITPQIRTEIISKAGHDFTFVQPELINQIILNFLADPHSKV